MIPRACRKIKQCKFSITQCFPRRIEHRAGSRAVRRKISGLGTIFNLAQMGSNLAQIRRKFDSGPPNDFSRKAACLRSLAESGWRQRHGFCSQLCWRQNLWRTAGAKEVSELALLARKSLAGNLIYTQSHTICQNVDTRFIGGFRITLRNFALLGGGDRRS